MLIKFIKLLLLFTLSCTNLLLADGADIQININNAPNVQENAAVVSFSITLSEEADYCDEVIVNYNTANGSALAGDDYTTKSGVVTFYGECDAPVRAASSTSQTLSIAILDDATYEPSEYFFVNIGNTTTGYFLNDSSAYVYIDDDDTQILELTSFADRGVTETDSNQVLSMVAYFNKNVSSEVTVNYHTEDNSALAGTDYVASSGSVTVPVNSNNAVIPITITGDITPELLKDFKVVIDSISTGTLTDSEALIYINDDDGIQVDISSTDVQEGNVGDNNQMEFKIFLTKDYPSATPLTIDYTTQDGSSPSATAVSDYTATSGSVTFNLGDREKIISVPIIGDDVIEPDENLKMFISGSTYIIDVDSEAEIINDDGSYPAIDFSTSDLSIVEGNTSTKILNFNFTLDADAIAGSSFEYYTQDDDALASDNDYQELNITTYNIPVGTRDINIPITINGDTKIENDETFYLKFQNEQNIVIHGHTAKGHILNDDGSYPKLSFDLSSFSMVEGNTGTNDLNFSLQLDQAAIAGSTFDYMTVNGSASTMDSDYLAINTQTHTFVGGERTISLPVTINGDTNIEANEDFNLTISNASEKLKLNNTIISAKGVILNDDATNQVINNIGEFKFDDCGADEWKIDHSSIGNDVSSGTPSVVSNDGKAYMCTSLNGLNGTAVIPHHSAYEVDNGTFSMLLYDHHNVWSSNSWMFQKGALSIEVVRVGGNSNQGSLKVNLDGNVIDTQEVFFTNSDGGDLDTQWIHVALTFGTQGMKLYVNGIEKGSHAYTGGIKTISDNLSMATLSGYYDEFYIFDGQMNTIQIDNLYQNTTNNKNIDGTTRDCGCYVDSDPFTCDSNMYISSSTNRITGATGRMWLHRVNTAQNPFNFEVIESTGAAELYNATAYNPDDNYIYGLYHNELIQISRGSLATNLGTIPGLPSRFTTKQLYAGAIADGYYYVTGRNSKQIEIYKIRLSDKSVTIITLSQAVAIQDFSFYKNVNDAIPDNTFLHGVDRDGKLTKIDVRDGTTTAIGSDHIGYEFDSSFSDMNGRFFANDSNGNGFFEFDLLTGNKNLVSNSQSATFNDGANCINAALVFNDYGDAPASYGMARHNLANGIFMGTNIDHDTLTFHSNNADGDDLDGMDDEDGVTLVDGSDLNGQFLALSTITNLQITVPKSAYLNTWIDFNIDGDFDDLGEKIVTARYLTTGTHTISVNVPAGLTSNTTTYMRFRYSSTATLTPTQAANDGEVEDYAVQFGSDVLKGIFNIERTNSHLIPTLNSDERNAWYTQFVGRDFDYSIVFYEEDFSAIKDAIDVTFKIELYNNETNNSISEMLPYYGHFSSVSPTHRQSMGSTTDLNKLSAYKDVEFRISYASDGSDGIIQAPCPSADYEQCFNTLASTNQIKLVSARDNFSIRPEDFYISIADKAIIRKENIDNARLRVAAGYDYNLTVIATQYPSNNYDAAKGYDANFVGELAFDPSTGTCANESNLTINTNFTDGKFNDLNFTQEDVGKYILKLKDTTWTKVDADEGQCTPNQSNLSATPNSPSGCDIETISDVNLSFYPHHFDVDFTMNNLPSSGHDDFIYMSNVTVDDHNVSLQFDGSITAKSENDFTTKNFTNGCFAQEVTLTPISSMLTDDGLTNIQTAIHATRSRVDVDITRMARFNNEAFNLATFTSIQDISTPLNISADKFLNDNNGTSFLDLRYNIEKHLSLPINPVQITFQNLFAESSPSYSTAEGLVSPNYIPNGLQDLNNSIRNFYFSQVSPDMKNYPKIFANQSPIISTPLNVDIFCNAAIDYCKDTGIHENTDTTGLSNVMDGWYISTNHNTNSDGVVRTLVPNDIALVSVAPDSNVTFTTGRNSVVTTTFNNNCPSLNHKVTVRVIPESSLLYSDDIANAGHPSYSVGCSNQDSSSLTGIGQTGNIINNQANEGQTSKIDW
ncbi:MAG: Unknown protein [uncultured Sulfurovum sp.]|uniref:Calx-beta domain-containing protein n=1 Tax=uncultured Sulfurovum sp. TaxID=269237 RepID=A0A6S6S6Q9_9BACT|nr:MAG: Unknown protein [uncultured Sulfurovum sp.]